MSCLCVLACWCGVLIWGPESGVKVCMYVRKYLLGTLSGGPVYSVPRVDTVGWRGMNDQLRGKVQVEGVAGHL